MKTAAPTLDQIPLFAIPQRGGKRVGAGRKSAGGSTTVRVPNDCLKLVTEIIAAQKAGKALHIVSLERDTQSDLKPVTEIKSSAFYLDKYINPDDPTQIWSGRGRIPTWVYPHMTGREIPERLLNPNPTKPQERKNELA